MFDQADSKAGVCVELEVWYECEVDLQTKPRIGGDHVRRTLKKKTALRTCKGMWRLVTSLLVSQAVS